MQPSISEFYHTEMGDIFVGSLVGIGIFLIAYKGYPRQPGERLSDQVVATIAGISVIGVALFPVEPPTLICSASNVNDLQNATFIKGFTSHWCSYDWIHFVCAAGFFICMVIFCFSLFPRGHKINDCRIDWKNSENRIYGICGTMIVVSVMALFFYCLSGKTTKNNLQTVNYVFWFETLGVISFAIAWLTKGRFTSGVVLSTNRFFRFCNKLIVRF